MFKFIFGKFLEIGGLKGHRHSFTDKYLSNHRLLPWPYHKEDMKDCVTAFTDNNQGQTNNDTILFCMVRN